MKKIPALIPHFQHADRLEKCKQHLVGQTGVDVEIYVRDNNTDNILYTAAINEGLRKYCYSPEFDYVLILNQDAYLDPDALQTLAGFMDATPACGIASPIHVSADRKRVTWGGSTRAFPFGGHRCDPLQSYTAPVKTHWANGACMLIRTETVREAGLFDKNMRFICSDADFSFTARLRGWHIYVVPGALCEHTIGTSAEGDNDALTLIKLRDTLYFGQKWLDGGLYRQIAWEGQILKDEDIRTEINARKREIAFIQQRIAANHPPLTPRQPDLPEYK
jgi:GT2 family glycosyltransferase